MTPRMVAVAVIVLLAIAAVLASEHSLPNAGLPVVQAASRDEPAPKPTPKPPIAWRLNPVCQIDPLKPIPEHVV